MNTLRLTIAALSLAGLVGAAQAAAPAAAPAAPAAAEATVVKAKPTMAKVHVKHASKLCAKGSKTCKTHKPDMAMKKMAKPDLKPVAKKS